METTARLSPPTPTDPALSISPSYRYTNGSLASRLRRRLMRATLLAIPDRKLQALRHAMVWGFVSREVLSQAPRFSEANSARREIFWRDALEGYLSDLNAPIDYFEFGVHQGKATRYFLSANQNPESRFFGFDSFEGLPEDWKAGMRAGHFSTGGSLPDISDPRVQWVPGFFKDSLPGFFANFEKNSNSIIVNFDADLYSSTVCAMSYLTTHFPGRRMLWIFDEFLNEEAAAFETFAKAFGLEFHAVNTNADHMRTALIVNP